MTQCLHVYPTIINTSCKSAGIDHSLFAFYLPAGISGPVRYMDSNDVIEFEISHRAESAECCR